MNTLEAIYIIEGETDADEERALEAWQHLVDTETVWHLQGSYQRAAVLLIEAGMVSA